MTHRCSGCCGKVMDGPEKWCSECYPAVDSVKPSTTFTLKMDLFRQAYRLAFGTRAEAADAIEQISFLVSVLAQET